MTEASTETTQATLQLEPGDVAFAKDAAKEAGVEVRVRTAMSLEPVTTVTLVIVGTSAAVGLVMHLLEKRRGGQIIDLMGAKPEFRRSRDLAYGLVVILLRGGEIKVEVHEPKGLLGQVIESLTGILGDLAKAPAEAAREKVEETVGKLATVARS